MTAIGATALSALLYALLFPPYGLAALSWVALLPFALAVRASSARRAALLAALFGWWTTLAIIPWVVPTLHEHFEKPLAWSVVFLVLFATTALSPYYALAFALQARAARRLPGWLMPLFFAAAWVSGEYARTQLGFRSPWTRLGDAHFAAPRLRQLADLGGVYALSALVALGNATLALWAQEVWRFLRERRPVAPGTVAAGLVFAGLLVAALAYGEVRRHLPEAPPGAFGVVLVQGNLPAELRWRRSTAARVLHHYGGLTRDALHAADADAPQLVVWPENALQIPADDPFYGRPLRRLVKSGVPLLLGAPRSEMRGTHRHHFNSAFLVRPEGPVEHYDKRRLLPFSETRPFGRVGGFGSVGDLDVGAYTPGSRIGLFRVADQTLGVLICMEALYPELAREARRAGATVLVNLSNDGWYRGRGGAGQHLIQTVFRAVETGLPLVRSTTTGVSVVVAPNGAILARFDEGASGVLRASLPPPRPRPTLYARVGDAFALSCVAACVGAAVAVGRRSRDPRARVGRRDR